MSTPTAKLFSEIRNAAQHDLERLEIHAADESDDAPTEGELVVMEELKKSLELTVLLTTNFLDE
jgi:hypothetical protein